MFIGHKKNAGQLKDYLHDRLATALSYIVTTDFSEVEDGEYELDGRNVFARVSTYMTETQTARRAEKHDKYIDVQFVAQGMESIGYGDLTEAAVVTEDESAKNDVRFYAGIENEAYVEMREGNFAIFFPWELHRPNCVLEKICWVKKVVVKVLAEDF